jgi:uroporphyrin-III C-methyltransferase/precorrin-2 dehydrogenase/sirohydrochlorin ferrochelatase
MNARDGSVALVGAGPGDPDLLTRRAVDRLAAADLVVYDALVDPRALALAPTAKRLFVGKRAGRPSVTQEFINRALIRAARRGLRVVRLKGGDPFVFGRGGEEALALTAAGVPFEIVPGITAAIAAPAAASIPVTHRGVSSAVVVVSGHAEEAYGPVLRSLEPGSATVVVLMGLAEIAAIARLLVDRGWPGSTPVAIVARAWTPHETTATTTLASIGDGPGVDRDGPATIVIGAVVDVGARLAARGLEEEHDTHRTA